MSAALVVSALGCKPPSQQTRDDPQPTETVQNAPTSTALETKNGGLPSSAVRRFGKKSRERGVIWAMAISPDESLLAASCPNNLICVWDVESGDPVAQLAGHGDVISELAFHPSGNLLASGSPDGWVMIWNLETGYRQKCVGHVGAVHGLEYSTDGKTLVQAGSEDVVLWDGDQCREQRRVSPPKKSSFHALAVSPSQRVIATGDMAGSVRIFDSATGALVRTLKESGRRIIALAFSPDGHRLAAAGDDSIIWMWDVATGRQLGELRRHEYGVHALAFTPNGQRLASAGGDRRIVVWDAANELEIEYLDGHENLVTGLEYLSDGKTLASSSTDGTLVFWETAKAL